eukprot:g11825.t1
MKRPGKLCVLLLLALACCTILQPAPAAAAHVAESSESTAPPATLKGFGFVTKNGRKLWKWAGRTAKRVFRSTPEEGKEQGEGEITAELGTEGPKPEVTDGPEVQDEPDTGDEPEAVGEAYTRDGERRKTWGKQKPSVGRRFAGMVATGAKKLFRLLDPTANLRDDLKGCQNELQEAMGQLEVAQRQANALNTRVLELTVDGQAVKDALREARERQEDLDARLRAARLTSTQAQAKGSDLRQLMSTAEAESQASLRSLESVRDALARELDAATKYGQERVAGARREIDRLQSELVSTMQDKTEVVNTFKAALAAEEEEAGVAQAAAEAAQAEGRRERESMVERHAEELRAAKAAAAAAACLSTMLSRSRPPSACADSVAARATRASSSSAANAAFKGVSAQDADVPIAEATGDSLRREEGAMVIAAPQQLGTDGTAARVHGGDDVLEASRGRTIDMDGTTSSSAQEQVTATGPAGASGGTQVVVAGDDALATGDGAEDEDGDAGDDGGDGTDGGLAGSEYASDHGDVGGGKKDRATEAEVEDLRPPGMKAGEVDMATGGSKDGRALVIAAGERSIFGGKALIPTNMEAPRVKNVPTVYAADGETPSAPKPMTAGSATGDVSDTSLDAPAPEEGGGPAAAVAPPGAVADSAQSDDLSLGAGYSTDGYPGDAPDSPHRREGDTQHEDWDELGSRGDQQHKDHDVVVKDEKDDGIDGTYHDGESDGDDGGNDWDREVVVSLVVFGLCLCFLLCVVGVMLRQLLQPAKPTPAAARRARAARAARNRHRSKALIPTNMEAPRVKNVPTVYAADGETPSAPKPMTAGSATGDVSDTSLDAPAPEEGGGAAAAAGPLGGAADSAQSDDLSLGAGYSTDGHLRDAPDSPYRREGDTQDEDRDERSSRGDQQDKDHDVVVKDEKDDGIDGTYHDGENDGDHGGNDWDREVVVSLVVFGLCLGFLLCVVGVMLRQLLQPAKPTPAAARRARAAQAARNRHRRTLLSRVLSLAFGNTREDSDSANANGRSWANSSSSGSANSFSEESVDDSDLPELISDHEGDGGGGSGVNGGHADRGSADDEEVPLMWDRREKPDDFLVFHPVLGVVPAGEVRALGGEGRGGWSGN